MCVCEQEAEENPGVKQVKPTPQSRVVSSFRPRSVEWKSPSITKTNCPLIVSCLVSQHPKLQNKSSVFFVCQAREASFRKAGRPMARSQGQRVRSV